MASWWKEDKNFTNRSNGWCGTVNLREPYIYLMALIYRLYGEKDCSKFFEAWMPLACTVVISGSSFNSGAIVSNKLNICVHQAQSLKEGEPPSFHMALYLLDVICTRNVFVGMNLSWHVVELPVHIYFHILWKNMYKNTTHSFAMNSSPKLILLYLKRNARDYPQQPIKW
jgi:hypothetical protein